MSTGETSATRRHSGNPALKLGGVMTIGAGVLSLQNAFMGTVLGGEMYAGIDLERLAFCSVMVTVFGIVAVAGGVCALLGRHFSLALAGAFLGMISGGLISFWLGLGALVVFAFAHADL